MFCCTPSGICLYTVGKDSLNFFEYLNVTFSYICICINLCGILLVCECAYYLVIPVFSLHL